MPLVWWHDCLQTLLSSMIALYPITVLRFGVDSVATVPLLIIHSPYEPISLVVSLLVVATSLDVS